MNPFPRKEIFVLTIPVFLLLTSMGGGCANRSESGNVATSIADYQGDWTHSDGGPPELSLDADGRGVLSISIAEEGTGRSGLSISRVQIEQSGDKFMIEVSVGGAARPLRYELLLEDDRTLTMKPVDSTGNREFTLKKQ